MSEEFANELDHYEDDEYGWCNACGEEGLLGSECENPDCDSTGEMVEYED
jgi:hypothetical protein